MRQEHVLLHRRFPDASTIPKGFPELYYCTRCSDYFVLAWHRRPGVPGTDYEIVDTKSVAADELEYLRGLSIFCPVCRKKFAEYGPLPVADVPAQPGLKPVVYESFTFPFPKDRPESPDGRVHVGTFEIEKIVLLVSGAFARGEDVRSFAYDGFDQVVLSRFQGAYRTSPKGGVALRIFRVSHMADDTAWVQWFLNEFVYSSGDRESAMTLTCGVLNLEPPLQRAIFCLVLLTKTRDGR